VICIALTGATGFLGRAIAQALLARGAVVRALARDPSRLPQAPGIEPVRGDLRDGASFAALLSGVEGVIHCAGLVKARSAEEFFAVNAEASERLAQAAETAGARRFVLISSLAAREPQLSPYAASKAAAEAALARRTGLAWTILRPPGIYGPGDEATAPLLRLARAGVLPVLGPAQARLSLIHVADAAEAAAAAYAAPATVGRVYELDDGSGGYDWGALSGAFAQALGRPVRSVSVPSTVLFALAGASTTWARWTKTAAFLTEGKARELRHGDWVSRTGDLAADAGWRPVIELERGLRETCFPVHTNR